MLIKFNDVETDACAAELLEIPRKLGIESGGSPYQAARDVNVASAVIEDRGHVAHARQSDDMQNATLGETQHSVLEDSDDSDHEDILTGTGNLVETCRDSTWWNSSRSMSVMMSFSETCGNPGSRWLHSVQANLRFKILVFN